MATKIQTNARGYQTRQHVKVKNVAPGIDHVQVKGNKEDFSRLGFEGMKTRNGPKKLDYLRVSGDQHEGHVAGGPVQTDVPDRNSRPAAQRAAEAAGSAPTAYIIGGYYNFGKKRSDQHPTNTPIGETTTSQGETSGLPIPSGYADHYGSLSFPDKSKVTSAPVLTKDGQSTFPSSLLEEQRFKFDSTEKPGGLSHAEHPNARAAIVAPAKPGVGNDYRLALGTTSGTRPRGRKDDGFTMPEWSEVSQRLGNMNQDKAGTALNMDGGQSAMLGVGEGGQSIMHAAEKEDQTPFSTVVAFSPKQNPPAEGSGQ